jgi:hypothetical protein
LIDYTAQQWLTRASQYSYTRRGSAPTVTDWKARDTAAYAVKEALMRSENIPTPPSPARTPLAPYDPPAPAPQAIAWRRALKVVGCAPPVRNGRRGRGMNITLHGMKSGYWK